MQEFIKNPTTYGGAQSLCRVVLFVFVPFDKNTLGDVIVIRDESGDILATYSYDTWGKCTVMDGYGYVNTSSSFIGNINPFHYRTFEAFSELLLVSKTHYEAWLTGWYLHRNAVMQAGRQGTAQSQKKSSPPAVEDTVEEDYGDEYDEYDVA